MTHTISDLLSSLPFFQRANLDPNNIPAASRTIRRMCAAGKLPAELVGGQVWLISGYPSEIARIIAARPRRGDSAREGGLARQAKLRAQMAALPDPLRDAVLAMDPAPPCGGCGTAVTAENYGGTGGAQFGAPLCGDCF